MNNSADQRLARASMAQRDSLSEDRMRERDAVLEALREELHKGLTPDESYPAEEVFNRLKRKYGMYPQDTHPAASPMGHSGFPAAAESQ